MRFGNGLTNTKMDLMKIHLIVNDIENISKTTRSDYYLGKAKLTEAKNYLRTDTKKALKYSDEARSLFLKESSVATKYNGIIDKVDRAHYAYPEKEREYRRLLSVGDFKKAKILVDELSTIPGLPMVQSGVDFEVKKTDSGYLAYINNKTKSVLFVDALDVRDCFGNQIFGRKMFNLSNGETVIVKVSSEPPVNIHIEYMYNGKNINLTKEIE